MSKCRGCEQIDKTVMGESGDRIDVSEGVVQPGRCLDRHIPVRHATRNPASTSVVGNASATMPPQRTLAPSATRGGAGSYQDVEGRLDRSLPWDLEEHDAVQRLDDLDNRSDLRSIGQQGFDRGDVGTTTSRPRSRRSGRDRPAGR